MTGTQRHHAWQPPSMHPGSVRLQSSTADQDSCDYPAGQSAAQLLQQHPKLLLYTVLSDGSKLQRGQARASVDVVERNGAKFANVNYWREGAAFNTAPLTPWRPSSL